MFIIENQMKVVNDSQSISSINHCPFRYALRNNNNYNKNNNNNNKNNHNNHKIFLYFIRKFLF